MINKGLRCIRKVNRLNSTILKKYVVCSYDYKLVSVDDKLSKPFKSYFGEDAVCNLINSMVVENTYCCGVMKKHFNKKLIMAKEDDEDFENPTKCWICGHI